MEPVIRILIIAIGLLTSCFLQDIALAQSIISYRGMFICNPVSNTDTSIQLVVDTCINNNINIVYLSIFKHLSPNYWTLQEQNNHQKLIHALHSHGIRVHALFGNNDGHDSYGLEPQWVIDNVVKTVLNYNTVFLTDKFDGLLIDAEYWVHSRGHHYNSNDVISLCDLSKKIKSILNIPIGFSPAYYLVNNGVNVFYDGYNGHGEAFALINAFDYLVVQDYFNNAREQIIFGSPWIQAAQKIKSNKPILLASKVMPDSQNDSYNTGNIGDKNYMELQHVAITNQLATPYAGQVIFEYQDFLKMK